MKDEKGNPLAGRLNVIFFDLVKIRRLINILVEKLSKLEKWGLFLSYADSDKHADYIKTLVDSEGGLMNARSSLPKVSQDEINWARQHSIYVAQHDYNDGLYNAEKQGLEQGKHEKAIETAQNALAMQLSPEQTVQLTGLPLTEILALKEKINSL